MLSAVLAGLLVVSYAGAISMAFINLAQAPLFNSSRFNVRVNGSRVKFVSEYHVFEPMYITHKHYWNRGCALKKS